jgi:predicted nucleotidyltransferase
VTPREPWSRDPSVIAVERLARALGEIRERVVFIGGAIAPLLHSEPLFYATRPTDDVDAIAATHSYADYGALTDSLRARGFREDTSGRHAHRWIAPDETLFDLVPAGDHLGGTDQNWDQYAIETAAVTEISDGLSIRHASAPAFLALKLAAFRDRGATDPYASHDLEDIIALIASRTAITQEVENADSHVRGFVRAELKRLREFDDFDGAIAGNLGAVGDRAGTLNIVHERIMMVSAS